MCLLILGLNEFLEIIINEVIMLDLWTRLEQKC